VKSPNKFVVFLADRFTGRNAANFEVHDRILTRPNMVTVAGIILTTFYICQFVFGFWLAFAPIILVLAVSTDMVDGWLADRLNEHSVYGKMLDPLRDRYVTFAVLMNVYWLFGQTALLPIIVTIAADVAVLIPGWLIYRRTGKPAAVHLIGKVRAAIQWVGAFLIVAQAYWVSPEANVPAIYLLWVIAGSSVTALLYYGISAGKK